MVVVSSGIGNSYKWTISQVMYVVPIVIEAKKWIVAVGVKSAGGKSMLLLALLELPSSWLCTHRFWKKKKRDSLAHQNLMLFFVYLLLSSRRNFK